MKKIDTGKDKVKGSYACAFLKMTYACAFLIGCNSYAFDHYSVEIVKEHFVINIDKCSYRERLKRNKTGYETKDVIRRALQACKKV